MTTEKSRHNFKAHPYSGRLLKKTTTNPEKV